MNTLSKALVAAAAFAAIATSAFSQVPVFLMDNGALYSTSGTLDPTGNFYRP